MRGQVEDEGLVAVLSWHAPEGSGAGSGFLLLAGYRVYSGTQLLAETADPDVRQLRFPVVERIFEEILNAAR